MASFDIREKLSIAAKILLLSALAVPCTGLAQSAFEPFSKFEPLAKNESQQQIVDEIRQEEAQQGSFSSALIEPWTALALLYEEGGSRTLAIEAIEQARQVVRANYGLRSMKEAPLMRQEVHIDEARGDAEAAWGLEQNLLTRVSKNPRDLAGVPILREAGDERLDWLRRYRGGEVLPQIALGCYYDKRLYHQSGIMFVSNGWGSGGCDAGDRDRVIGGLYAEAKLYYSEAIAVLVRNRRYSSDELRGLEAQLIRTSYASSDYLAGKKSYRRLIGYNAANSASWLDRIETYVQMTDWDLLFSRHGSGTAVLDGIDEAYAQAYELLEGKAAEQSSIDEFFSPKIPIVLPSFLPNPLITKPSSDSNGYIDVAFDVTKYGEGEHVKILHAPANAPRAAKRDLVRLIRHSLFRPRVKNGKIADDSPVVVRYFLEH
ncbi:MAG TPA: hypothetical protein VFY39_01430 [Gammaproteobacteria bacterium]|nr:hypothetical protein [Gammaproteobacteria bacterium]